MSQPILIKVYGNLHPASSRLCARLQTLSTLCLPMQSESEIFHLRGSILLISFEGIYFPLEETLAAISGHLQPEQNGKLDYLDMENWTLRRYIFADNNITETGSPLNNVLDYSGF